MKMKMKNTSRKYDKNRPRCSHERKYSKYKKCISMIMLMLIKQDLNNIWSSVYEKVNHRWGWVEKR